MSKPWMMTRARVAEKLRWFDENHLPRLDEGDALLIAKAAGYGDEVEGDTDLGGLVEEADTAICDLEMAHDGGNRDEIRDAPEIRKRLLPEVVAAEEAEASRIAASIPPISLGE
jgi:hypothetical protein